MILVGFDYELLVILHAQEHQEGLCMQFHITADVVDFSCGYVQYVADLLFI